MYYTGKSSPSLQIYMDCIITVRLQKVRFSQMIDRRSR